MECKVIRIPRWLVATLGTLFAVFQAALGISSLASYENPTLAAVAIALYLAAVLPSMNLYRSEQMPVAQAIFNFSVAALVPLLINSQLDPKQADEYSTWYVIGIATLMAATAVRQRRTFAWAGTAIMVIQVIAWDGFIAGWQTGLAGALMLVFAGHTISRGLEKAYQDTKEFTLESLEIRSQQASNAAASEERSIRLEAALQGALPMLKQIESLQGKLSEAQKIDARLLEASLRDEIRGRGLMSKSVREAARQARSRGVEVIILDEGGLDEVTEDLRGEILEKVAAAFAQVGEGRITLRAPSQEAWRVTLVATRSGIAKPDLWLKF